MKYTVYFILSIPIIGLWYVLQVPGLIFVYMILLLVFLILNRCIGKPYSLVVIFPPFLIAMAGLVSLHQVYPLPRYDQLSAGQIILLMLFFCVSTIVMIYMILVRLARKDRDTTPLSCITIAVYILGILSYISAIIIIPYLVYLSLIPAVLGTILAIMSSYRRIMVAVICVWSVTMIGGWIWMGMIDNGLDTFVGQERVVAERAIRDSRCNDIGIGMYPNKVRVIKEENGEFRVLGYTWWGLPSNSPSCGPYRQGNRW